MKTHMVSRSSQTCKGDLANQLFCYTQRFDRLGLQLDRVFQSLLLRNLNLALPRCLCGGGTHLWRIGRLHPCIVFVLPLALALVLVLRFSRGWRSSCLWELWRWLCL